MSILNLTYSPPSHEQLRVGVVDPLPEVKGKIQELLTFRHQPSLSVIETRASHLAAIAAWYRVQYAMIGGPDYLIPSLERALTRRGIRVVYPYTRWVWVRDPQSGATTHMTQHVGWVLPKALPPTPKILRLCDCGSMEVAIECEKKSSKCG